MAGGIYILWLRLAHDRGITVGKLGRFCFPAGVYAYVGSARGPGGLEARIARHWMRIKRSHWHIDDLRPHCRWLEVWLSTDPGASECGWARALMQIEGATTPVRRFGSTGCGCSAHLIHLDALPDLTVVSSLGSEVRRLVGPWKRQAKS